MSSRSPLLPVLLFGFIVSATPFQPKNESAMKLSATPNLVTPTFPSNASAPPLNASGENTFNIRCDGETYGYNPNILDCESAKEYIVPDITIFTFGERGTGLPEVVIQLPYRLMGDRGLCYMQAVLVGDHITGKASLNMLRGAAGALVLQCAAGAVSQGGIATGIGGDNNIAVVLGIYQLPVSCRGKIAHWEACREILWGMRADNVPRAFGPRSDPDVTEPLPHSVDSMGRRCSANIFSTGKTDVASWYDMWEAVNAVFSVCVRYGYSGSIRGIGEHGDIFLTMTTNEGLELPGSPSQMVSS